MTKLQIALRSPAFWSIIGLFVYSGLESIAPQFGGNFGLFIQAVLVLLAAILHPQEVHTAAITGKVNGVSVK